MRRKLFPACLSLLALAFVLTGSALAGNGGIAPPAETPQAERIQDLYWIVLGISGVIFLLVEGALIAFLVRFRRRNRPVAAEGPQIHGNTRLEVIWTIVPVLLVALIVGFVFYKLPEVTDVTEPAIAAPGDANMRVSVYGRQFYWEFRYPDGSVTYDTMVVPVNRTVELMVTAPKWDVIHSWWIPALGGKIDAIPGNRNRTWFRAERVGEYEGTCTEFCGVQHAAMTMKVRALPDRQYQDELARLSSSGKEQFGAACAKCHNVEGAKLIGPTLLGNPTLADQDALAELVRNGRNAMPPVGRGWTDEQVKTLFDYVKRFAGGGGGGGG